MLRRCHRSNCASALERITSIFGFFERIDAASFERAFTRRRKVPYLFERGIVYRVTDAVTCPLSCRVPCLVICPVRCPVPVLSSVLSSVLSAVLSSVLSSLLSCPLSSPVLSLVMSCHVLRQVRYIMRSDRYKIRTCMINLKIHKIQSYPGGSGWAATVR